MNNYADSYETHKNLNVLHGEKVRDVACDLTPKMVISLKINVYAVEISNWFMNFIRSLQNNI